MSVFGNSEQDNLYSEMTEFLKSHPVWELIDILRAVLEYREEE